MRDVDSDETGGEPTERERHEAIRRLEIDIALARNPELTALETRLYKHVVDCIDFDALFGLEQVLWFAVERLGLGPLDNETGLSHRLIERALVRAAHDPWNAFRDVPFGITTAEERAVRFDPECLFCEVDEETAAERASAERASAGSSDHEHGGEACSLCDEVAREWRAQHADALRAARERQALRATGEREAARQRATARGTGA